MKKTILSILLILCLVLPLAGAAADTPVIDRQPESVIVKESDDCVFQVMHGNTETFLWRFVDPDSGRTVLASKAPDEFPGLRVDGEKTDCLTLKNIPLELDGWGVFCRLANGSDSVDTTIAMLSVRYNVNAAPAAPSVTAAPIVTPAPAVNPAPRTDEPDGEVMVRVVNGYLQMADSNGSPTGERYSEIPVTGGSIDVAVTANGTNVHAWILNGVRYDFEDNITRMVIRNVTESLVFEPVIDAQPQTLKSAQDIQDARTGDTLIVKSISSRMHFLQANGRDFGGKSFREFDFTNDYANAATNQTENGGQISVRVTGEAPENYRIYGWKFNDMRLTFNGEVLYFIVHTLDRSMVYEPIFGYIPTPKPIPNYSVTCYNCTFSGGGYSHATSGTVKAGTHITIHLPTHDSGFLEGDLNIGTYANPASGDYSYTVNHDSHFEFYPIIN